MSRGHSRRELLGCTGAALLLVAPAAGDAKAAELDGELIALCEEHVAYQDAVAQERASATGIPAGSFLAARREVDPSWTLAVRISRMPARTPEGIRAKARVVRRWLRDGYGHIEPRFDADAEAAACWSLVNDLLGRAGA